MIIKYQNLLTQRKLSPVYILNGSNFFLINECVEQIKNIWLKSSQGEYKILELQDKKDWIALIQEARSLSLFTNHILLDARFDKKSISKDIITILNQYLAHLNPDCLLILRIPNVTLKTLTSFGQNSDVSLIQCSQLKEGEQIYWIKEKLKINCIYHTPDVPLTINQYTKGNLLAASKVIDILKLINSEEVPVTSNCVKEYLIDQSEYSLYEFKDQCLLGDCKAAIHIIRQMLAKKFEPTLILWILSEEVRKLINLNYLLKHKNLSDACSYLKIWSSQIKLYQNALNRLSLDKLFKLLESCHLLDIKIKSSQIKLLEVEFEKIILLFADKGISFA